MPKYDFKNLKRFEHAGNPPDENQIQDAMTELAMMFGPELYAYLFICGYLAHDDIELTGMTRNQGVKSDLIVQTLAFRELAPWAYNHVVIESLGESRYILTDSWDRIYKCDLVQKTCVRQDCDLFDYIQARLGDGRIS